MAINKVIYGGDVLIDLTGDSNGGQAGQRRNGS